MRGFSWLAAVLVATTWLGQGLNAAPLIVDPSTGLDSEALDLRFVWLLPDQGSPYLTSPGFITYVGYQGGPSFEPIYRMTVSVSSEVDIRVVDLPVPGDSFELWMDGSPLAWSGSFIDGNGNLNLTLEDLAVSSGAHDFTILVLAGSWNVGAGYLNFSAARAVPEPVFSGLFGAALVALASRRRRTS